MAPYRQCPYHQCPYHQCPYQQYPARLVAWLLVLPWLTATVALAALPTLYETEPNDTPAEAGRVAGEMRIQGTLGGDDQDGFLWTVSDDDAETLWDLELMGIPAASTQVEVIRIEWTDDGSAVAGEETLTRLRSADGTRPGRLEGVLFAPGEYLLGVSKAGDDGGYRLAVRRAGDLRRGRSSSENADAESAETLRPSSQEVTYVETPAAWWSWTLDGSESGQRWRVVAGVPVGVDAELALLDAGGRELATTRSDDAGRLALEDLGLDPGTYRLRLRGPRDRAFLAHLQRRPDGRRVRGEEAEPNDRHELANRVDLSQPLRGRLAGGDTDAFRFEVGEEAGDRLWVLELESAVKVPVELCLTDDEGQKLQCREGEGGVALEDLGLAPGSYGAVVQRGRDGLEYTLRLRTGEERSAAAEMEPNDRIELASAVDARGIAKGRFVGTEEDAYRFVVSGEPQLWRIQAIGDVQRLTYRDGSGRAGEQLRAAPGARRLRMSNLYLLPGIHYVTVLGRGGDYTLRILPIGPPDPAGEREPNDDASRSHPLRWGEERTGLLEETYDVDAYRFSFFADERIRLTVEPPTDGALEADLSWDGREIQSAHGEVGEPLVLEGRFLPGDYQLDLSPRQVSEAEYRLRLERLDPFTCPVDCEPNDSPSFAAPWPGGNVLVGRVGAWGGEDWYRLPAAAHGSRLVATAEGGVRIALGEVTKRRTNLDRGEEENTWSGDVPEAGPGWLVVRGEGEYEVEVTFDPELPPAPPGPTPPGPEDGVDLQMRVEAEQVAAYREVGQTLGGTLRVVSSSDEVLELVLRATTSHRGWRVTWTGEPASSETRVQVDPGSTLDLPFEVAVPPDAFARETVRIGVGAWVSETFLDSAWTGIVPENDVRPVHPTRRFPVPDELLGGLDVAWSVLGGRSLAPAELEDGTICTDAHELFDGSSPIGKGMYCRGNREREPVDFTVELAGDAPLPVSGFLLQPQGRGPAYRIPREYEIFLSADGATFDSVARGGLVPYPSEQAVILPQPVEARYARLRFLDNWENDPALVFGEWKVVARPGVDPSPQGRNLADPDLGGHVVWGRPNVGNFWGDEVLTETAENLRVRVAEAGRAEMVIGFHNDRAAKIESIEWVAWPAKAEVARLEDVRVAFSLDSPLGPWHALGSWDPAASPRFDLGEAQGGEPPWARFVKISGTGAGRTAYPETLRIYERPTGPGYRSILAEWGELSSDGPYEASRPVRPAESITATSGNRTRERAQLVPFGRSVSGRVSLDDGSAWYGLAMPDDRNTLRITLEGEPSLRAGARLEDAGGERILLRQVETAPRRHVLEATVEPGSDIYLEIFEPPRNVVFAWDTSGSVNPYEPFIYQALSTFAEGLEAGREEVNLLPFGGRLLLEEWSGHAPHVRGVLNEYPRTDDSSNAEKALIEASEALAERAGTRAIVLVTDAATSHESELWPVLDEVRPRIFALGVPSSGAFGRNTEREADLLQDWALADAGHFAPLATLGEMERGFDRLVAKIRRPADFRFVVDSRFEEAPGPGRLKVSMPETAGGASAAPAIELILDASGSMLQRLEDGRRRIDVAKQVLSRVVREELPPETSVALRVFGHRQANACRTDLEVPLQPVDREAISERIAAITAKNLAKTPIADSLAAVPEDLAGSTGRRLVVLVTDGEETCDGDPREVLERLEAQGFELTVNIVGFALDDPQLERTFEEWAQLAGGRYFAARDSQGLDEAVDRALELPFRVFDAAGTEVAEGLVGGEAVELPPGIYRVVIPGDPPTVYEEVEIRGEESVELEARSAS